MSNLLDAAKPFDLLTPVKLKDKFGKHAVQEVVHEIRHMRNNIHAGVALRKSFNPATFRKKDYLRIKRIFDARAGEFRACAVRRGGGFGCCRITVIELRWGV